MVLTSPLPRSRGSFDTFRITLLAPVSNVGLAMWIIRRCAEELWQCIRLIIILHSRGPEFLMAARTRVAFAPILRCTVIGNDRVATGHMDSRLNSLPDLPCRKAFSPFGLNFFRSLLGALSRSGPMLQTCVGMTLLLETVTIALALLL